MAGVSFSGIASGIDSDALIKAQSDATRKARVTPLQTKVGELTDTNDALATLTTKLKSLQTKLLGFASISGGPIGKTASSTSEDVATASASSGAAAGSYSITVTTEAKNGIYSFNDRWSSLTTPINSAISDTAPSTDRSVVVTIGTGSSQETVTVPLTSTSTATDFVTAFNSTSTKALASLVNVGTTASPSYALTIVSNKEGTQDGTISVDTSAVQIAPALSTSTSTAATDAQFSVSGITGTITRSTNAVSDVIPGVTLNIRSAGTSIIAVKDDPTTTVTKIQDFVDSFNDIVKFKTENNTITQTQSGRDIKTTFGALGETRVDENAIQGIRDALISSSYSNGSSIKVFADLGITTQRDGTLALNTDTLKSALSSESNSVKNILQNFGNTVALTGGTIDVYTRFNGLIEINRNNNTTAIDSSNARISSIEQLITRDEDAARARFARLEAVIGNFQSQQARLTSALAGLQ